MDWNILAWAEAKAGLGNVPLNRSVLNHQTNQELNRTFQGTLCLLHPKQKQALWIFLKTFTICIQHQHLITTLKLLKGLVQQQCPGLVLERRLFRIMAGSSAILIKNFCDFFLSLRANAKMRDFRLPSPCKWGPCSSWIYAT